MMELNIKTMENTIIKKIEDKSFFVRFRNDSETARKILSENPRYKEKPVIIIQMCIDKDYIIFELLFD